MGFGFVKRSNKKADAPRPEATAAGTTPAAGGAAPSDPDLVLRVYAMGPSQEMRYATELLSGKGLAFEAIDVTADPSLQGWIRQKTGSPEYPQVFLGKRPLGDYGALRRLDLEGNLDRLLAGLPPIEHESEETPAEGGAFETVRVRLRRGDVLSLTTPDGETFDTWAEVYANPPTLYWRGEPLPIDALDTITGEIVTLQADPRTDSVWSTGR